LAFFGRFQLYGRTRGVKGDSCGFEHVFVGEVKEGKATGFHNWIRLYLKEKCGRFDYKGFIK
jgi:poly(U)-specific endoribonuclease